MLPVHEDQRSCSVTDLRSGSRVEISEGWERSHFVYPFESHAGLPALIPCQHHVISKPIKGIRHNHSAKIAVFIRMMGISVPLLALRRSGAFVALRRIAVNVFFRKPSPLPHFFSSPRHFCVE